MRISKRMKKSMALVLGLTMVFTGMNQGTFSSAAKKAKLGFKSVNMKVGEKKKISLKNKVKKAKYLFKSNKTKVASVSKAGLINAKSKGNAKITVKQKIKKKTIKIGTISVKVVKQSESTSVTPENVSSSITPNQTDEGFKTQEPASVDNIQTGKPDGLQSSGPASLTTPSAVETPSGVAPSGVVPTETIKVPENTPAGGNGMPETQKPQSTSEEKNVPTPGITMAPIESEIPSAEPIVSAEPTNAPSLESFYGDYNEEVLTIKINYKSNVYQVEGNTCDVTMNYFDSTADSAYFNGKTKKSGSNVIKKYKDGREVSCARFILSGNAGDGSKCTMFVEDNAINRVGDYVITKPTIITNNENLSFLQTADIRGFMEKDESGSKILHVRWNKSNTVPVPYPEVNKPDTKTKFTNEVFTFSIGIGTTDSVKGADSASASMIHFTCEADSDTFKGKGVDNDFVDTRMKFKGQTETLSARYIMEGKDDEGKACKIYVENNGIDNNGNMVTEPIIITDNPKWAWIETAKTHGTVTWSPGLTIHLWAL